MAEPQTAFNQQTGLRLACNAFVQPELRIWIGTQVLNNISVGNPLNTDLTIGPVMLVQEVKSLRAVHHGEM